MSRRFSLQQMMVLLTVILGPAIVRSPAQCQIIRITNTDPGIVQTLSDLEVRDDKGHVKTVLKPGEKSGDDINIEANDSVLLDTGFGYEIKSVDISRADEIGGKYVESETRIFKASDLHGREIEYLATLSSNDSLAVALDAGQNFPTFPGGTILNFVNGANPNLPGWFVGTNFDPNVGVLGPYTGSARVLQGSFTLAIIPEPSGHVLLSVGMACLIGLLHRRIQSS